MCREPTALFGKQSSSTCSSARPKAFRQCVEFSEGLIGRSNPELYRAPGLNSGYVNQFHVQVTEAQVSQDCPWHMVGCGPRSSDLGFGCSCSESISGFAKATAFLYNTNYQWLVLCSLTFQQLPLLGLWLCLASCNLSVSLTVTWKIVAIKASSPWIQRCGQMEKFIIWIQAIAVGL